MFKLKKLIIEGKNYFWEYVNKGYDDDFNCFVSLCKLKNWEISFFSYNFFNSYCYMNECYRDIWDVLDKVGRFWSRLEFCWENERYCEFESDDYYRE